MNNFLKKSIETLKQESNKALDVFTKTVIKLESLNNEISDQSLEITENIISLESDLDQLKSQKEQNSKIINKINTILND